MCLAVILGYRLVLLYMMWCQQKTGCSADTAEASTEQRPIKQSAQEATDKGYEQTTGSISFYPMERRRELIWLFLTPISVFALKHVAKQLDLA